MVNEFIGAVSDAMYGYILIILLLAAGLYFSFRTKFVQFRMLGHAIKVVTQPADRLGEISSFRALMVSTGSRVGVGNIAGVSTAIVLGGTGSVFWMWVIAILGAASAFVESTLAQIYKRRDADGSSYGGPAYYIQAALHTRALGVVFASALIFTYMGGFNMVASFNIASAFEGYSFSGPSTPVIVGLVLAVITALSIFRGTKRLSQVTGYVVPFMAGGYMLVALIIVVMNIELVPSVIGSIFTNAFDFEAIFGGFAGSAIMYGIKRGLYSNEAGVGSAPNAAAAASVSHPVKQGLVQMLSVYIDTIVVCTATAFMLLASGVEPTKDMAGVPYVQEAVSNNLGWFGHPFVTGALFLFAFTSIIGNFFYAEFNLRYLLNRLPRKVELMVFRGAAVVLVFVGALLEFDFVWGMADVLMGVMALLNIPVIVILGKRVGACLADYTSQLKQGKDPAFLASSINLPDTVDFWQGEPAEHSPRPTA